MFLLLLILSSAFGYNRLKKDVYPTNYHLILQPSFQGNYTFSGDLRIQLVANNTNTITLDCKDLNVTSTSLYIAGLLPVPHEFEQANDRLIITSSINLISAYDIGLVINFNGHIRQDLIGFHLSKYQFEGKQRLLGSTQFESNHARTAFPCFDEPSFRANFSLEVIVHPNMSAISNQPALSNIVQNGMRRIVFAENPSTPTYLIAWIIYEPQSYGYVSKNVFTNCDGNRSLTYSVWSDLTYQNETLLALNAAPELVSALENFTGVTCEAVKYKMDLAAIPDFQSGAMENWEIITFRESALLYNNVTSSVSDKQSILMVVAHELVHQWFGNLVTLDWWSYTWLNEGFARYFQYFITDQLYPEMNLMGQFLADRRQIALEVDSSRAHPLTNLNITTQDDIDDMFDEITYDKGASVIHMWRTTLGDEVFRRGLTSYLNNVIRSGGVADPGFLFSALFSNTSWNNNLLGSTWTLQSGYPIIVAIENQSTLTLKQIKVTGWNVTKEGQWKVPISIRINNALFSYNLEPNGSLQIQIDPKASYVINSNQNGFYRVMYHNISRWFPNNVTDLTKSMIINDAMALSKTGLLPYETTISVVTHHLKNNTGYYSWSSALRAFSAVDDLLQPTELGAKWREIVLNLMDGEMRNVALNDIHSGSHILMLHKINLLKYGCKFDNINCLTEAGKLASNLSYGTPEKRAALLCTVVRMGNEETWNQVFERYNSSKSPTEKQTYLRALTCTTNKTVIQKFLRITLTKVVRKQDVVSTIKLICNSPEGAEETLQFIKNNYEQLLNYLNRQRKIRDMLVAATKYVNDTKLVQVKQMASTLPQLITESFIRSLEQTLTQKKYHVRALSDFFGWKTDIPGMAIPTVETGKETSKNHSSRLRVDITWVSLLAVFYIKYFLI